MDTSTDLFLGKVIHGYRLKQLLGRGALTAVYQACAEEEGTVKTLIATLLLVPQTLSSQSKERFKARFFQTAKQLEALRHPSICPFYGYGELDGHCYLLSPDTNGKTLSMLMAQKKSWTSQEALALLVPIAEALEYLHSQGVICQFFSPANVLLVDKQEDAQWSVQLTSIGFLPMLRMKGLEEHDLAPYEYLKSVTGSYLGNPEYLAPEIVKGMEGDTSTDVYSLGILLFALLSGSPPFTGESYLEIAKKHIYEPTPSLHDRAPDLPVSLELVINHALYRYPAFRFQNPNELVAAYMHVINERVNMAQNMSIVKKIQQTYKMAAIEPRLLPPGAKRTVEIRSLSSPSIGSDYYPTPQKEQTASPHTFGEDDLGDESGIETNEEEIGEDVAEILPEKSVAEKSTVEVADNGVPPLGKTEETSLSGVLVPRMIKIGNHIHLFASELSELASRFTISRITAHRSSRVGKDKHVDEESSDHVKDHKNASSREGVGSEGKEFEKDEREEEVENLFKLENREGEQKRGISSEGKKKEEQKQSTSSKKENVREKKIPEKKVLEINQRVTPFESIRTKEANVEITTMIIQIQQLRERLQSQAKDQKQNNYLSSKNDGKKTNDIEQSVVEDREQGVMVEEFPGWLN